MKHPGTFIIILILAACAWAQNGGGLHLLSQAVPTAPEFLLDPSAAVWKTAPATTVALNRTPPAYASDPPSTLEIPTAEVRLLRAGNALLVRLTWKDPSRDVAELGAPLPKPETGPQIYKAKSEPGRFFDSVAVMVPAAKSPTAPSLQMGSANLPVVIYFLDMVRGPAVMDAQGRGTTRRTGGTFPGRSVYENGGWSAVLQLPAPAPDTPLAFAVWNGSQNDRDGRKYFSVWHRAD